MIKKCFPIFLCFALLSSACSQSTGTPDNSTQVWEEPEVPSAGEASTQDGSQPLIETQLAFMASSFYLPEDAPARTLLLDAGTHSIAMAGGPSDWNWITGSFAYCPTLRSFELGLPLDELLGIPSIYARLETPEGAHAGDALLTAQPNLIYIDQLYAKPDISDTFDLLQHTADLLPAMEAAGFSPEDTTVALAYLNGQERLGFAYLLDNGNTRSYYLLEETHMTSQLELSSGAIIPADTLALLMEDYYASPREAFYLQETFYRPFDDIYQLYWAKQDNAQLFVSDDLSYELARVICLYQNTFQKFSFSRSFTDVSELNDAIVVDIVATHAPHFEISPSFRMEEPHADPVLAYIDEMAQNGTPYSYLCTGEGVRATAKKLFGAEFELPRRGGEVFRYVPDLDLYYLSDDVASDAVQYPVLYEYNQQGDTVATHVYHLWKYMDGSWASEDGTQLFATNEEARTWLQKNRAELQAYEYVFKNTGNGFTLESFTVLD